VAAYADSRALHRPNHTEIDAIAVFIVGISSWTANAGNPSPVRGRGERQRRQLHSLQNPLKVRLLSMRQEGPIPETQPRRNPGAFALAGVEPPVHRRCIAYLRRACRNKLGAENRLPERPLDHLQLRARLGRVRASRILQTHRHSCTPTARVVAAASSSRTARWKRVSPIRTSAEYSARPYGCLALQAELIARSLCRMLTR